MTARRIDVRIERLVLEGFEHPEGRSIASAIEQAVSQRFGDGARVVESRGVMGPVDVGAPSTPARIGTSVANAIASGGAR